MLSFRLSDKRFALPKLLGPAFVAAVAYVDPGNVAANITAGARYGYLLLWVLVAASAMSVFIQYQSAKLGLVTGHSLPELIGQRLTRPWRIAFWVQAELIAAATDLAEVIGGAIALNLLFGLPLFAGGVITGVISTVLLALQTAGRRQRVFEMVVTGLLLIIAVGFLAGLVVDPPHAADIGKGLVPRLSGGDSVVVAASMLGATVMPHAIYLHSSLVNHRFPQRSPSAVPRLLRAAKHDVTWSLILAGIVNIGLLVLAANSLFGAEGTDSIEGAYAAIDGHLGSIVGVVFGIGLLASGLASTSVGAYAGSEVMDGLLRVRVPLVARRVVTLIPALLIIFTGISPSTALVWSQAALCVGIPFAIVPLFLLTGSRLTMGSYRDNRGTVIAGIVVCVVVVLLNFALLALGEL